MILDPRTHPHFVGDVQEWRMFVKARLLVQRHYLSDLSGKRITESTGCHMHEGILTRANVPSNVKWSWMIYHEYNCFLLLPEEHEPQPPTREQCIQIAYARYGRDKVREWFYSLPFKSFPRQLP